MALMLTQIKQKELPILIYVLESTTQPHTLSLPQGAATSSNSWPTFLCPVRISRGSPISLADPCCNPRAVGKLLQLPTARPRAPIPNTRALSARREEDKPHVKSSLFLSVFFALQPVRARRLASRGAARRAPATPPRCRCSVSRRRWPRRARSTGCARSSPRS